jgi:hypothetical protein
VLEVLGDEGCQLAVQPVRSRRLGLGAQGSALRAQRGDRVQVFPVFGRDAITDAASARLDRRVDKVLPVIAGTPRSTAADALS